jgi:hypothetical protein
VLVVGLLQVVLDHHLLIAVGAEDVELEITHQVLGGDQLQLTDAQGLSQSLQVVVLGEPGREITGFVFPGLPQGHPFELAEGWSVGHDSDRTGSGRDSTSIWPESRRGRSRSRVRRRF